MSTLAWRVDGLGDTQFGGATVAGGTAAGSIARNEIHAGVVGDGATVVTISAQWTPTAATPSPFLSYTYGVEGAGVISIDLEKTFAGWGYGQNIGINLGAADGLLELTATVDGLDAENTLVIAISGSYGMYNSYALGYGVGAPSNRWTNIRQAVEV